MTDTFPSYSRISIPASDSQSDPVSGSYLRLGKYTSGDEQNYLPANNDIGSKSVSNCSGVFLKTNGALFVRVDGDAFEQYKKDLKIAVNGTMEAVVTSTSRHQASGILLTTSSDDSVTDGDITVTAGSGNVTVEAGSGSLTGTASGAVTLSAEGGDFHINASGHLVKEVEEDDWEKTKGTKYEFHLGATIEYFVGAKVAIEGALAFSITAMEIAIYPTLLVDVATFKVDMTGVAIELTKVDVTSHEASIKRKLARIESDIAKLEDQDIKLADKTVALEMHATHIDSALMTLMP